jgi:hypothetical protein
VYLEYTCKKPPYYTRRIPLSVTEELSSENKPVPCTEEEFQSSGRAAAQFGANWDGVKAPPPGETPPPQQPPGQGGGGGKGDVPPGANKYDCLSDDAKRSLRLTQDLLVGAWLDWQRAFAQLPSIVQRAAATADAHKVVKAKLDAAAKSGDVEATDKANGELWNASNRLESAKKDLEKLKDYLKWAQDRIAAYK